jgi:epoxyqueuosine reductase
MENRIKEILRSLGADDCKIASIDRFDAAPDGFNPKDIYADCKSVIVFIRRIPKGLSYVNPRIVYHHASDINVSKIDDISFQASLNIEEEFAAIAVPIPCDGPYEYWDAENKVGKGLISMRHAAKLSGLGSIGKNTLLVNRKFGNMINIGLLLTNLDLESDDLEEDLCIEGCNKCIENCPSKALDGIGVSQKLCREHTYANNGRGFSVVNCNRCRIHCPLAFGKKE